MNGLKQKGITLIALVVTIVVLLILAGVSINLLLGDNGIIKKTTEAKEEYSKSSVKEKVNLLLSEHTINNSTGQNEDLAKFLRQNLQVGVAENDDNTYSFILGEYQVITDENSIISIEKFNLNTDKTYANVEHMKADTELTAGKLVRTEGYYSKTLGGGAYYDIVNTTEINVDNAKCIQLNNGLYAKLYVINSTVSVNQFGAYGDGEHDDAGAIQLALNSGYNNVSFENEKYIINDFITIGNDNTNLLGNNTTIAMKNGFQFSKSFDWAIFIGGTQDKQASNINLYNLKIETNEIEFSRSDVVQIKLEHLKNCQIYNCEFLVPAIDGNKSRPTTNIWINGNSNNISIENCKIINLSNSNVGGNIWISDSNNTNIDTVKISNNYIEKSSHDETIGIWDGNIKNIVIENNEFNIHEENVDIPSDMNFTFGSNTGLLQNIEFSKNRVNCASRNYLVMISPSAESKSISIDSNNIEYTFCGTVKGYNPPFNNRSDIVIDISNNNITYNTSSKDNPGISAFAGYNENFINNNITINGKMDMLETIDNNDDIKKLLNTKFENNNIKINTDIYWLVSSYYFCNNVVEINGFINEYRTIFRASFSMQKDMEISNNTIHLNTTDYKENNVKFLYCQNHTFNNYNIYLKNNTIQSDIKTDQMFIAIHGTTDITPQTIICNNNNYNNFKYISFYNNLSQPIVNINGNKITSDSLLE